MTLLPCWRSSPTGERSSGPEGDPDVFIVRIKRYQELGADEVILRLDGTREQIMCSIELIGKYVIPTLIRPYGALSERVLCAGQSRE